MVLDRFCCINGCQRNHNSLVYTENNKEFEFVFSCVSTWPMSSCSTTSMSTSSTWRWASVKRKASTCPASTSPTINASLISFWRWGKNVCLYYRGLFLKGLWTYNMMMAQCKEDVTSVCQRMPYFNLATTMRGQDLYLTSPFKLRSKVC